jgi:calcineurin-like phosphoesterase family protein
MIDTRGFHSYTNIVNRLRTGLNDCMKFFKARNVILDNKVIINDFTQIIYDDDIVFIHCDINANKNQNKNLLV